MPFLDRFLLIEIHCLVRNQKNEHIVEVLLSLASSRKQTEKANEPLQRETNKCKALIRHITKLAKQTQSLTSLNASLTNFEEMANISLEAKREVEVNSFYLIETT